MIIQRISNLIFARDTTGELHFTPAFYYLEQALPDQLILDDIFNVFSKLLHLFQNSTQKCNYSRPGSWPPIAS